MNANARRTATTWTVTILRMVVGWHLLCEGVIKLLTPGWTAADYLGEATGPLGGVFRQMVDSPQTMHAVNLLNAWGLTLIGAALVLGLFTRIAASLGAVLLLTYYLSNPPFIGMPGRVGEGSYLFVNKNLIEAVTLVVLATLPRSCMAGLDAMIRVLWRPRSQQGPAMLAPCDVPDADELQGSRRLVLKHLVGVPAIGALGYAVQRQRQWNSLEEKFLLPPEADAATSATLKHFSFTRLSELKGTMTYGQIGSLKVSRLTLGGNLVGGWAHARDLMYVSDLIKAYHNDERVIGTFRLAEKCGVNTFITHPKLLRVIRKYWNEYGGNIQYFADCGGGDVQAMIKLAVNGGAHACYVQGATADNLVAKGKTDELQRALDAIRKCGKPAGIGGHRLKTIQACVEKGIRPDFWMKTLHHHNYWSSRTTEGDHDNNFCLEPEDTIAFMKTLPEPWIAFKVLAAGAIAPADGFAYAFNNGADFICVGMYDFQVVKDVNIACQVLAGVDPKRPRPWRA